MASIGPYQAGQVLDSAGARTGFALSILGDSFQRHIREVLAEHELKPRQLRILICWPTADPSVSARWPS